MVVSIDGYARSTTPIVPAPALVSVIGDRRPVAGLGIAPAATSPTVANNPVLALLPPREDSDRSSTLSLRLRAAAGELEEDADVDAYCALVASHIVHAYGSGGRFSLSQRTRAAGVLHSALDNRGLTVFTSDLNTLLASPLVRGFMDDLDARLRTATPEHSVKLWDLALAHAGGRDEAIRWLAVLLQDYSPRVLGGHGCLDMVDDPGQRARLQTTLSAVADAMGDGRLAPLPDGSQSAGAAFYHYYVPAYLAQRMVARGVAPDLAFLSAATFNLEYEIAQPAVLTARSRATVGWLQEQLAAKGLTSEHLAGVLTTLRRSGQVDDSFMTADLDLARDLHLAPADIRALLDDLARRYRLLPAARAQLAAAGDLSMNAIADTVNASYLRRIGTHVHDGAWLGLGRDLFDGRDLIAHYIAAGGDDAVAMPADTAQSAFAGFEGAANALRDRRLPWDHDALLGDLARDPAAAMRRLFATPIAVPQPGPACPTSEPPPTVDATFAQLATTLGRGTARTRVGVIDTAFNTSAPSGGWDFIDGDADPTSRTFHVLHGSELLELATRGTPAITAIPLRADLAHLFAAIDAAADRGATCVVISQKMYADSAVGQAAFRDCVRRHPNMLIVVSSGNDGQPIGAKPFELTDVDEPNLVVVAAATRSGRVAPQSSYHPRRVQFAVRGGSEDPRVWSGYAFSEVGNAVRQLAMADVEESSHAAPAFASLAARVRLLAPELTAAQVVRLIGVTAWADDATASKVRYGIPDAARAERLAAVVDLATRGKGVDAAIAELGFVGATATEAKQDYFGFSDAQR